MTFSIGPTIHESDSLLYMVNRINNDPPMWGEYGSAAAYYKSPEWLEIVQRTLDNNRVTLGLARRAGNSEAIKFYSQQVRACELALNLTAERRDAVNPAQASLFNSLLGIK